ncbi:hypothetical protein MYCTH_2294005 [Thermothelomyces thermophilus ATCC 42464]|uniref:Uncharacterized protein n=1 Tax=Thermothelomyces thermophilus (strain ATCC 42464 / BCRC 31852 / DSM 1799) TaxID=573729 RepID=G2PZN2_THET4|nr:uncharacterized protein MYCTH_2294005 [Thermothelomyces thermophilus ATCC 42464]AEO53107.1 hypothetical protein MYCTH_2294005 [Thermothelomyces thermophilus ATCC 42464]
MTDTGPRNILADGHDKHSLGRSCEETLQPSSCSGNSQFMVLSSWEGPGGNEYLKHALTVGMEL